MGRVFDELLRELVESPVGPGVGIFFGVLNGLLGFELGILGRQIRPLSGIIHGVLVPTPTSPNQYTQP